MLRYQQRHKAIGSVSLYFSRNLTENFRCVHHCNLMAAVRFVYTAMAGIFVIEIFILLGAGSLFATICHTWFSMKINHFLELNANTNPNAIKFYKNENILWDIWKFLCYLKLQISFRLPLNVYEHWYFFFFSRLNWSNVILHCNTISFRKQ